MFGYIDREKNNVEELINVTNQIIIDEINFINGLCFVYSKLKDENPDVFKNKLDALLKNLLKLKNVRDALEEKVNLNGLCDVKNLKSIDSLSKLQMYAEKMIEENLDETVNNIVEMADVNGISMDQKFEILAQYLDDEEYQDFLNEMYNVNQSVNEYITSIIGNVPKTVNVR